MRNIIATAFAVIAGIIVVAFCSLFCVAFYLGALAAAFWLFGVELSMIPTWGVVVIFWAAIFMAFSKK